MSMKPICQFIQGAILLLPIWVVIVLVRMVLSLISSSSKNLSDVAEVTARVTTFLAVISGYITHLWNQFCFFFVPLLCYA